MQIGIMADSHDDHANVLRAVDILNEYKVDYVLHAGDLVSPFTAKAFAALKAVKFIAVFGNNEGEKLLLKSTIESFGGEIHEYCYKGQIGGKKIYMTHTDHHVEEVAASQMYDVLIYGHTHKQDIRRVGKTLVINPGETTDWITSSPQLVILNVEDMSYHTEKIV
ncbi:MAG: metallophosphoesterase [Planctomycetota bacterium]|jgi:putative phosphoesterase